MLHYYFDIETHGPAPKGNFGRVIRFHKPITIQYRPINIKTGSPRGKLIIHKSWESSEKEIIEIAIKKLLSKSFAPVGKNVKGFDISRIAARADYYNITDGNIHEKLKENAIQLDARIKSVKHPWIIKTEKKHGAQCNSLIGKWFANEKYDTIVKYIICEAWEFFTMLKRKPYLLEKFRN